MRKLNPERLLFLILLVLAFLVPVITKNQYLLGVFCNICFNIILAVTLNLMMTIGHLTMAHFTFMGLGAYTTAILITKFDASFWLSVPVAGIVTGLVALVFGSITLRVKGIFFVMMVIAFAEVLRLTIGNLPEGWLGGFGGIAGIPFPDPIGIPGLFTIHITTKGHFYYLLLLLTCVIVIVMYRLNKSRYGKIFETIENTDILLEQVGVNTIKYKVFAFTIVSFFVGLTGSFYASYYGFVQPETFNWWNTVNVVLYVVIGGSTYFFGPILGAVLLIIIGELLRPFEIYTPIFLGGVLILVVLFLPKGIYDLLEMVFKKVKGIHRGEETTSF